jgi:LL-diaminopimelate aminotransferase
MKFLPAHRIAGFESYYFATLGEKIQKMKKEGKDVIRLDIGSPDLPPTKEIIDALCSAARNSSAHGYTLHSGTKAFREAIADYYRSRFKVDINPNTEVLSLIGSKEGLFNLCQAFLNPGDLVLVPSPGYPVYAAATTIAGATTYTFVLKPEDNYLPDFRSIPDDIAQQARMMWLNYPNNPTGAVASLEKLEEAVAFAKKFGILLVHDAPYTELYFGESQPPSILQVPGAKEVTVEFNSLSKTYNMAGWRVGYACGNADVINYLKTYKSQLDSANFLPVLDAAIFAIKSDQSWLKERNHTYAERRDIIIEALTHIGIQVNRPDASLYVWTPIPAGFENALDYCDKCLEQIHVSIAPGQLYGPESDKYIRFSLGCATDRVREAMDRLKNWH